MFTAIAFNKSSWLEQKNHGFSIDTRPVLDHFPLVYRRPNENLTRIGRISNERRTKEGRKKIEKMTRNYRRRNEKLPNLMGKWQPSVFVKPNEQNRTFRTWGKVNEVRLV